MDSGNSGSIQSSSGGDDEFDSRGGGGGVDSSPLSALLRPSPSPSPSPSVGAFSLHGSLYSLQELTSVPPPQAAPWSAPFPGAAGASSSSPRGMAAAAAATSAAQTEPPPPPPRASRKRTRASRRAPTTVLTTDTTNFRAMVQEFTGIPSPPFVAGAAAPASLRSRFDHLFPSPSSLRSAAGAGASAAADPASLPPYLLRPFAQKLQNPPPFSPFSSSSSSTPSSSNIGIANANATTATAAATAAPTNPTAAAAAGDSYQLTTSALLRMQDPNTYLSFQNILGPQSSQPMFGAAGGFPPAPRLHDPPEFLAGGSSIGLTHGLMVSEGLHLHSRTDAHGGDELSGVVAAGASGSSSCKLNYASRAAADADAEKTPDGGSAATPARTVRGEGLDSWICTSE